MVANMENADEYGSIICHQNMMHIGTDEYRGFIVHEYTTVYGKGEMIVMQCMQDYLVYNTWAHRVGGAYLHLWKHCCTCK